MHGRAAILQSKIAISLCKVCGLSAAIPCAAFGQGIGRNPSGCCSPMQPGLQRKARFPARSAGNAPKLPGKIPVTLNSRIGVYFLRTGRERIFAAEPVGLTFRKVSRFGAADSITRRTVSPLLLKRLLNSLNSAINKLRKKSSNSHFNHEPHELHEQTPKDSAHTL
jgi:hypothetical protein